MIKNLCFIIGILPTLLFGQFSIQGQFLPVEDFDWVLLYKVTPENSVYIDRTNVDREGFFQFDLDSTNTKGMYRLVYAMPQEDFNFDVIYNAKENVSLIFNEETGIEFNESTENIIMSSYTNSMGFVSQSIGNYFRMQSKDTVALNSIFHTQRETQDEYEKISKNTIAHQFIKANRPYIPQHFEDIKTYIDHLKIHYFDNVDFNDEVLLSSNFLVERTLNYVFGMTSEVSDSDIYKKNVDAVFKAMNKANLKTKKTLLHIIWQQMVDTDYEVVANYISDKYLMNIAKLKRDEAMMASLKQFKSLSIGQVAPDFGIQLKKDGKAVLTKLSELHSAECYVVLFWSSNCGHCLEELPVLHEIIKDMDNTKLKIVAIGLEDDEFKWLSEKTNFPEFIHVIGLGKWENEIGNAYNVTGTPTYYVLDKDKKISAKPGDLEALKKAICD